MTGAEFIIGMRAIGAGLAVIAAVGAGVGIGNATASLLKSIARQPEASGKLMSTYFIGCALAETTAIYGLLISFILLFVGIH
ncbi:ATP synthase F0 subunit C [Clostridium sardiniense]|uniref:ATP synthase subunit c n=1 Tax=Clostridium sardiniense TaxID=29369 RepID=A0ABS7KY53_CLOSR|nr:ATP synthase F0 subunit C [Clostridium sardiniense]MBM7835380.1 F-type H+-transporting ATPase subunit c [Clostridium sardiniense]MBY0755739.1 ATP synthase F0 subunit C [Clostridium sardiniense]MDQ0460034.1 F-type H+-transporting ATPase subunit c [Clostridium sardiniense]